MTTYWIPLFIYGLFLVLFALVRAVELGLPSVAFTEHLDLTPWFVPPEVLHMFPREGADYIDETSTFHAPAIDFAAYFESIDRCRTTYPSLRILTGLEIGEPHWFPAEVAELVGSGRFERILGSLHSARVDGRPRSKTPARSLTRSTRRTASSTSDSSITPPSTSPTSCSR